MTTYTYIDNSNLYIEGCRISAVKKGMAADVYQAMNLFIVDHTWNMDYGKLYDFISGEIYVVTYQALATPCVTLASGAGRSDAIRSTEALSDAALPKECV